MLVDSPSLASRIAQRVHRDSAPRRAGAQFAHVRRVADAVAPEARNVAWLHDVIEDSSLTGEDLRLAGFSADEVEAVLLLTRDTSLCTNDDYLAHIARIADARRKAGQLAREVKTADLRDRLRYPRVHAGGWVPPYVQAARLLGSPPSSEATW